MKFGGLFCLILLTPIKDSFAQNYIFAQLTGTPINTAGWTMQGDARIGSDLDVSDSAVLVCSEQALTRSSTGFEIGGNGSIFYNQPINLSFCQTWTSEFDFRIFDGTGADGLTFCFLDVPPVGFVSGGGLGVPATANGLKVCFDTWNNCIPYDPSTVTQNMPKIEIRWGPGYSECPNYEPTRDNEDGQIYFIRGPDYNHAKITYDKGNISVYLNGKLYLTGYQTFSFAGYLGFTASTGGYNDNHSIKNVVIYTQMPPSFAGSNRGFCAYDTIQIGGPANPEYVYSWTPGEGLNNAASSAPLLHVGGDSLNDRLFTYYVHTAFKDNPGCASIDSIQVKVYPNPSVHFTEPKICLTDAIANFKDNTLTHDSTTLPFTYRWSFGDPAAGAGNPNTSEAPDPSHTYSAANNYLVGLAVTNSMGCSDSLTKTFTVNGAVPFAAFSVSNATVLCSNESVDLFNESTVDFGSITRVQIFWGDSVTVSYTDDNPWSGKKYSHNYPNPVSTNVSGYKIRMISFSGIECENETDRAINIEPAPHVQFNKLPSVCLYDSAFQVAGASEISGLPGSFVYSGEGISASGIFDPKTSGVGDFLLLYQYNSSNGCVDSGSQSMTVIQPPKVFAGYDTSVVINQPLQLQALTGNMNDNFLWTPATGLNDPAISNPVAILGPDIESIHYLVKATDDSGCFGEATITVKVFKTEPDIFVPNAFTPGFAINHLFRPIPVGISSIRFFRVYNRWGQLVYSSSGINAGWDGTVSGKPEPSGGFVWMVQGTTYTGKTINKQGTMVLIR